MIIRFGNASRKRSFTVWLNSAALDVSTKNESVVQRPGLASSASIIGRATASPVIIAALIEWSWTSCQTSSPSNFRCRTVALPRNHWLSVAICAAPCMSGGITRKTIWPSDAAACSARENSEATRSPVTASMPWARPKKMSSERHMTPFGMPVVPPV